MDAAFPELAGGDVDDAVMGGDVRRSSIFSIVVIKGFFHVFTAAGLFSRLTLSPGRVRVLTYAIIGRVPSLRSNGLGGKLRSGHTPASR